MNLLRIFLSTLSLRRATGRIAPAAPSGYYFYPRSPCGERLMCAVRDATDNVISIHALLAESDFGPVGKSVSGRYISIHALLAESDFPAERSCTLSAIFLSTLSLRRATCSAPSWKITQRFLSTLSLRRATSYRYPLLRSYLGISIHALLAESDSSLLPQIHFMRHFYPRSPCGERRLTEKIVLYDYHFYPRSPCGERQRRSDRIIRFLSLFLSTLSLRRATLLILYAILYNKYFYPRSPCGERPGHSFEESHESNISIHALLAESDC